MTRSRLWLALAVLFSVLFLAVSLLVALGIPPEPTTGGPGAVGGLVVFIGLIMAVVKLWRDPTGPEVTPAPWTDPGGLVDDPPEEGAVDHEISGTAFVEHVERATERARDGDTIEESLEPVREPLRAALIEALVRGECDRSMARSALADGTWTADPVAAAVLDETVSPPTRSLRTRIWQWLFPEKAVRQQTARAMSAVSAAASETVPSVPGQRAPRPVPVAEPTLDDLQRAADGSLQQAVDGSLARREEGSAPSQPSTQKNDEDGETAVNDEDADTAVDDEDADTAVVEPASAAADGDATAAEPASGESPAVEESGIESADDRSKDDSSNGDANPAPDDWSDAGVEVRD